MEGCSKLHFTFSSISVRPVSHGCAWLPRQLKRDDPMMHHWMKQTRSVHECGKEVVGYQNAYR